VAAAAQQLGRRPRRVGRGGGARAQDAGERGLAGQRAAAEGVRVRKAPPRQVAQRKRAGGLSSERKKQKRRRIEAELAKNKELI
jgi:hypothetical protein